MAEGSDDSGSELGEMEVGGGKYEDGWNVVRKNKRKKRTSKTEDSGSENESVAAGDRREEFKVFMSLAKEGTSFSEWNPIRLTKVINKEIGEVRSAKILRNGSLLIMCRDGGQQGKALRINKLEGKAVKCTLARSRKLIRGVVSGIPVKISADEVKENVTNVRVNEVKRLKASRDGVKRDSLSVMIAFDEERLPEKIYIGYICYNVRPYVPPPLRCFKCQRFGHVAAVCKGKERCSRCGGEHEYGKCAEGAKLKCCNCGGEHSSAYRGCEASKKAEEVQRIKVNHGVSYAEAVKVVSGNKQVTKQRETNSTEAGNCKGCDRVKEDTLLVNKNDFLLFMADVINCSAQTQSRNERIKIIVRSAGKYLKVKGLSSEDVKEILNEDTQPSQSWNLSS